MDMYPSEFQIGDDGYNWLPKGPLEILSYTLDLTDAIGTATISTSTWAAPTGITCTETSISGKTVSSLISGGTIGRAYLVENTTVTSDSQTIVRKFKLIIVER